MTHPSHPTPPAAVAPVPSDVEKLAEFVAMDRLLNWNRCQPEPPVRFSYEYGVFAKAIEFYRDAARATHAERLTHLLGCARPYVEEATRCPYDGTNGQAIRDAVKRLHAVIEQVLRSSPKDKT